MTEAKKTDEQREALWAAINKYAEACGGTTDGRVFGNVARMGAVVEVEQAVSQIRAERDAELALLLQVAVEAIRLVHGSEFGDHYSHEPCGECGLGGHGSIRDALTKALGAGYTKLVWGFDMNSDVPALNAALAKSAAPQHPRAAPPKSAEPDPFDLGVCSNCGGTLGDSMACENHGSSAETQGTKT